MYSFYLLYQLSRLAQAVVLLTSIQEISVLDPNGIALLWCVFFGCFHKSGDTSVGCASTLEAANFFANHSLSSNHSTYVVWWAHSLIAWSTDSHPRFYILHTSSPIPLAFFCAVFSYFFPFFRCFPVLLFLSLVFLCCPLFLISFSSPPPYPLFHSFSLFQSVSLVLFLSLVNLKQYLMWFWPCIFVNRWK